MRCSIVFSCLLLLLLLLALCHFADGSRMRIPPTLSHLQDSCSEDQDQGGGSHSLLADLTLELKKRFLMSVNHEDYSDLETPPRLPEAQHGPVVFNHKKKRPRRSHGHP